MSDDPIINISDLHKHFTYVKALDGVDLKIHSGRIVGLVGANGGGKSTLLRHMVGLYLPSSGSCKVFGCEAGKLGPKEMARIGYLHQEGTLVDWMTVPQQIRYVAAYYPNWNHGLEKDFIKQFNIPLDVRVGVLSPGQRQKLAILLAIGFEPELLILDEPASALDPMARRRFLDLLLEIIQAEGRTIIISSHILSDVEKVIDHVLIMDKGKILRDCPFDALQEEFVKVKLTSLNGPLPKTEFFREVISSETSPSQAIVTMKRPSDDELSRVSKTHNCQAEIQSLTFEEIYCVVVEREV